MENNLKNKIIALLSKQEWMTAKSIAEKLNVSARTINNYINAINLNGNIILSSKRTGYKLNPDFHFIDQSPPANQTERIFFLIKALIQNKQGISTYELSSQLCISDSTLTKDLPVLKQSLNRYNLTLKNRKGYLTLLGEEESKRRLIRETIISQDENSQQNSLNLFSSDLINQQDVKSILISLLKENNLYISDYSLNNILIHSLITIDRLMNNNQLCNSQFLNFEGFHLQLKVAREYAEKLENKYRICFNQNEINQLAFLLITKTTTINFADLNIENVVNMIGESYYSLAREIIQEVNTHFYIDIDDPEFIIKFTLHLKNMLFRINNHYQERNPLTNEFKSSYPLVYDIAVFISLLLQKKNNIAISEDEIAYLSFHIGSIIERKNNLSNKLNCVFVYQNYYDFHRPVLMKLTRRFGNELEITDVVHNFMNFDKLKYDLILSMTPLELPNNQYILIHNLLLEDDMQKIKKKIDSIKARKNLEFVTDYLDDFFEEDLFETEHYFTDELQAIRYMAEKVVKRGFADQTFIEGIIDREKIASTSFDNGIAIPHSMTSDTFKNCAVVIINKKPIIWGNYPVRMMILIGINKNHRQSFKDLYTKLLEVLDDPKTLEQLLNCGSYKKLITTLRRCIHELVQGG